MSIKKNKAGFTLIELMMVIAIIGILASIVLVNLSSAQKRAKDAAIISSAQSMMQMAQIDSIASGNYSAYYANGAAGANWISSASECSGFFGSTSNQQSLIAACQSILNNNSGTNNTSGVQEDLWMGTWGPGHPKLSILAWLPGQQVFYCIGSNGASSIGDHGDSDGWVSPGCTGSTSNEW